MNCINELNYQIEGLDLLIYKGDNLIYKQQLRNETEDIEEIFLELVEIGFFPLNTKFKER